MESGVMMENRRQAELSCKREEVSGKGRRGIRSGGGGDYDGLCGGAVLVLVLVAAMQTGAIPNSLEGQDKTKRTATPTGLCVARLFWILDGLETTRLDKRMDGQHGGRESR
jgi:hypothetical protein